MKIIKNILIITLCLLFGVVEVYRGVDTKCAKEDKRNDDERERIVSLKAQSSAFKITLGFCVSLIILFAIAVRVTKNDAFIGMIVGVAIIVTIMFISEMCSYFYHNKRN
mgnify:FL=1